MAIDNALSQSPADFEELLKLLQEYGLSLIHIYKFRDWLKSQPPEEILHHTSEYTVREDIVMAMEELELTDAQAEALLESPSPLADVYRYFEKLETGYMDMIRDSIENLSLIHI